MNCTACATSVERKIKEFGGSSVHVNFTTGEAWFDKPEEVPVAAIVKGIESLGYVVEGQSKTSADRLIDKDWFLLLISALFTFPLLMHMFVHHELLMDPWFQLCLSTPVFLIGIYKFGKSAISSIRSLAPNMDVLIMTGSTSAYLYSLLSWKVFTFSNSPELYFETTASIITLVLLGNFLEHRTVRETTTALRELVAMKPSRARRMSLQFGEEVVQEIEISEVIPGDLLSVITGDKIPADGLVVRGSGLCNESMITGESMPAEKLEGSMVFGGTHLEEGSLLIRVQKAGSETLLGQIIDQVKQAQGEKPSIQKLGDRVSHVFVPIVMLISLLTFLLGYFFFDVRAGKALMSAIAVLVISCPCAMGLATPTAVMAGIGRATRAGILIRGGQTLENLSEVEYVVFDKTGTLTDGKFSIQQIHVQPGFDAEEIKAMIGRMEAHSNHPIARSVAGWERLPCNFIFKEVQELKGYGIRAVDSQNQVWMLGSNKTLSANAIHGFEGFDLFLTCNDHLAAAMMIGDQLRPESSSVIRYLKSNGKKVVLLSGDRASKCEDVASKLGITEVYSEKLPHEKTEFIKKLSHSHKVVMVGDGINDAPALASAQVGISLSGATDVAIKSAQVVLMQQGNMELMIQAFKISDVTMRTIKQNLFFSFFYNVIAIPIAAAGLLSPIIGALAMALSDVVVVGNSIRLKFRSLP